MAEDDTFRKLRQSPYSVVFEEYRLQIGSGRVSFDSILKKHHWTYDEFMKKFWERNE